MSSHHQQQSAGKRFLADLADALPDLPPSSSGAAAAAAAAAPAGSPGRPILGGGVKADLPDTAVHSWNVDVPDFVPTGSVSNNAAPQSRQQQQQQSITPSPMTHQPPWQQLGNDPINQLVSQSIAFLLSAGGGAGSSGLGAGDEDRDPTDAELNACLMRLYQMVPTAEDPTRLVSAALNMAKQSKALCEPAANLLSFLAVNFVASQQVCPHLISNRSNSRLAHNPIYEALLTVCSAENDRIRLEIANLRAASPEQANYILLFSWLYLYLPSLNSPTQRQGALAQNILLFLKQLAGLPTCPLAYRIVHDVLTAVGAPLDFDCCDPDLVGRSDLLQSVGEVYDLLRVAVASGRVGDPQVSVDLIRLLELRAASWMSPGSCQPPAAGFGGQQQQQQYSASGDVQAMTDDMFADYEQFLLESGQL